MSTRRLNVEITGSSRGLEAALNRINAGLGRTQGQIRQTNKEMGLFQRQLMAIGTTARYALAGQFVFGVTAAIGRLAEFQTQLGRVASLAGELNEQTGRYTGPGQGFLSDVGDQAILESNKVGIAVNDIQQYMTRFFSTFSNVPQGQRMAAMTGFVDEVARLGAMLGTEAGDPQVLAGGIASLVNQIDPQIATRRPGTIGRQTNRVANLISYMLASTPNVTGRDVARDIGRIGQAAQTARMTPEQAFAVWGQAGKAGGSAGVLGRGIAQLLGSSLLHPQTKEQIKAYQAMGLPSDPNALARMGGMKVLLQMMERIAPRGARIRNRTALFNEEMTDEEAIAASGATGINRTLLYQALGRQESVRQFIALLGQDGVKGLKDYLRAQQAATKANAVRAREEEFQRQNTLTRFNQQRANLNLGLARGIQWPLEHVVAPPVGALADAVTEHRTATQVALGSLFGGLAVYKGARILKALRNRRLGGSPGQELVGGLLATESAQNVLAGAATDGTRANPFWVIIHPVSWMVGGPSGGMGPNAPTTPGTPGFFKRWAKRVPPIIPAGGLASTAAATAVAAPFVAAGYDFYRSRVGKGGALPVDWQQKIAPSESLTKLLMEKGHLSWGVTKDIENAYHKRGIGDPVAIRMTAADVHQQFTIRLVDAQGRTITVETKKGLPMKFTVAKPAPTYKGKSRAQGGAATTSQSRTP